MSKGKKAVEVATRISAILELVEQMQATDTSDVEPMANPHDAVQILRKDAADPSTDLIGQRDDFLKIAPDAQDGPVSRTQSYRVTAPLNSSTP